MERAVLEGSGGRSRREWAEGLDNRRTGQWRRFKTEQPTIREVKIINETIKICGGESGCRGPFTSCIPGSLDLPFRLRPLNCLQLLLGSFSCAFVEAATPPGRRRALVN